MNAYLGQHWQQAEEAFSAWHTRGDRLAGRYLEQIRGYVQRGTPEVWPPVTTMSEK